MNTEELLAPLSDASPCGDDLTFSAEFDAITELRREDDPTLSQGEWITALKVADWPQVIARCETLLATRSKDLRLAMWLTEARALVSGYAGLQQGLSLCAGLCEQLWDGMHPQPEDGEMEQRIGNIAWLVHRVSSLAQTCPVVKGRSGSYSLRDMLAARSLQAALERNPSETPRASAVAVTAEQFKRALQETPKEFLRSNLAQLRAAQGALTAWQEAIDRRLGSAGPSFVPAREALGSAAHEVERLAREMGALSDIAPAAAAPGTDGAPAGADEATGNTASAGGPLRSRAQALQQLQEVAAFFRRTEPHSPVAYLADKAVQWGEMPLHLWLRSVVKDSGTLSHLEEMLGLPAQAGSEGSPDGQ